MVIFTVGQPLLGVLKDVYFHIPSSSVRNSIGPMAFPSLAAISTGPVKAVTVTKYRVKAVKLVTTTVINSPGARTVEMFKCGPATWNEGDTNSNQGKIYDL